MTVTDHTTGSRPPAWHPDPSGRHQFRWWDGATWTDQVRDGDAVSQDPPVRTREVAVDEGEAEVAAHPEALLVDKRRLPPELRPSTAPHAAAGAAGPGGRRQVVLMAGGAAVVLLALLWGWHNWSSANQWRDRSHAVEARLADRESNYAALERSIGNAASRGAQALDSQQVMVEMRDATDRVVTQIHVCARTLDSMIALIGSTDVQTLAQQAQDACGEALAYTMELGRILDELTASG